jgi:hypothetical protein
MFEDVRLIEKDSATKASRIASVKFDEIAAAVSAATGDRVIRSQGMRAKLQQSLQANLNEMFFTQRLILVEGLEDIAYIIAYLELSGRWEEYRRLGCHMIAADGKDKIIQPLAIANAMDIRVIVVFDSDADTYGTIDLANDPEGKRAARRPMHLRDNTAILKLSGIREPDPFPTTTLFTDRVVMWHSEIGDVIAEDIGRKDWARFRQEADQELGQPGGLSKNGMHIAIALEKAWNAGKRSKNLDDLSTRILQIGAPIPATTAESAPVAAQVKVKRAPAEAAQPNGTVN